MNNHNLTLLGILKLCEMQLLDLRESAVDRRSLGTEKGTKPITKAKHMGASEGLMVGHSKVLEIANAVKDAIVEER
jgi:hypothetical protein